MEAVNVKHKKEEKKAPNLRFPRFEGEWMTAKLEEFCNRISDGIHATPVYDDAGEYYFVNGNNLVDGKVEIDDNTKRVSGEEYVKHKRDIGDRTILMSINGTIGNLAYYGNEKVVLGKSACYINVTEQVEKEFIYNILQLQSIQHFFNSELTGTTIKNLSLKTIKNTNVNIPSLPEQQKIASFLSAVDQKIQQLIRKKELLEQYKKSVMHKIFSQEIRFKDENGNDYPDWDKVELGEILDYEQPTKYLVVSTEYDNNYDTAVLTAGKTFVLGYSDEEHGIFKKDLPVIIFDDFTTAFKYVDFPFKVKSSAMKILKAKSDEVNIKFVYESMTEIRFPFGEHKRYWISEYQYNKIVYPNIYEQKMISNFLNTIDKKINAVKNELDQTQQFKKGLLQQLFV